MSNAYIIRNHHGHYWGRGKRWTDGGDISKVAHFDHRDEVANTIFELSSKDIDLRCDILKVVLAEEKLPPLEVSTVPLPDDVGSQSTVDHSQLAPISPPTTTTTAGH